MQSGNTTVNSPVSNHKLSFYRAFKVIEERILRNSVSNNTLQSSASNQNNIILESPVINQTSIILQRSVSNQTLFSKAP